MTRGVASICDRHLIPRGRPADLVGFLRALGRNKHLAMDFWSVVSRMSRVHAETPCEAPAAAPVAIEMAVLPDWRGRQERTLEAIVRAIAGTGTSGMAAAGVDAELAAMHMASLLAGDDTLYEAEYREAESERGRLEGSAGSHAGDEGVAFTAFTCDPIPYVRMGDDELRRVLLGSANPPRAAVRWRVRVRLPLWPRMWLRRWADMWSPLVPPQRRERAPRGRGLMLVFLVLLLGAVVYAQSTGSLGDSIASLRAMASALEGLLRR